MSSGRHSMRLRNRGGSSNASVATDEEAPPADNAAGSGGREHLRRGAKDGACADRLARRALVRVAHGVSGSLIDAFFEADTPALTRSLQLHPDRKSVV